MFSKITRGSKNVLKRGGLGGISPQPAIKKGINPILLN
jgi:hypothetical protein